MKRLFLFLCCTLATALFADTWTDPETNITWTYTLSNGTVSLGGGSESTPAISTSYAGALTIPATINGSPVVGLNYSAFRDCSSLTSVVIPEGVTSIGELAFYGCSSLTSVVIPVGVTSIGGEAFCRCSSLTSVVIPEGVTTIEDATFWGCKSLTSVVIPEGVTSIGSYAFSYCYSLTSVVIPEGVTSIGKQAFDQCSSLTSVVIQGVTSIGSYAFHQCSSLTSVTFLGNVPGGWDNVYPSWCRTKIYGSSANCRKPFCPAATHPNTAGHFGKPRCRVGTPPLPGCIRRSALHPIIP